MEHGGGQKKQKKAEILRSEVIDEICYIWRIRRFETTSRQFRNYRPVISKLPAFFTLHTPFLAIIFFWFPNYVLRFSLDSKLPTGSFESTSRQFRNYRLVASKLPALSFDTTSLQLRNYQPVASKLKFNSFDTTGLQLRNYSCRFETTARQLRNYDHSFETTGHQIGY